MTRERDCLWCWANKRNHNAIYYHLIIDNMWNLKAAMSVEDIGPYITKIMTVETLTITGKKVVILANSIEVSAKGCFVRLMARYPSSWHTHISWYQKSEKPRSFTRESELSTYLSPTSPNKYTGIHRVVVERKWTDEDWCQTHNISWHNFAMLCKNK